MCTYQVHRKGRLKLIQILISSLNTNLDHRIPAPATANTKLKLLENRTNELVPYFSNETINFWSCSAAI